MSSVDNKHRDVSWQQVAAQFESERDAALRDLARMQEERDRYMDVLLSRHGGECLALISELDEARAALEGLLDAHARNDLFSGAGHWETARAALAKAKGEA